MAIYGAILGGVAAGALAARRQGLSIPRMADLAAPGLVLAQAIGRIGCLINGDALGSSTDLPWGLAYVNPGAMVPELGAAYQSATLGLGHGTLIGGKGSSGRHHYQDDSQRTPSQKSYSMGQFPTDR